MATNIPVKETIGLIQQVMSHHGLCTNKKPLLGFKECKGICNSGTVFNQGKT